MSYANIEEYFKYYEKQFYHYLVPWVVDDLRNREVVLKTHKEKKKGLVVNLFGNINYLDTAEQQLIRESIDRYFEFLFPEATFPHIELGTVKKIAQNPVVNTYRKRVRSNVLYQLDKSSLTNTFMYLTALFKSYSSKALVTFLTNLLYLDNNHKSISSKSFLSTSYSLGSTLSVFAYIWKNV